MGRGICGVVKYRGRRAGERNSHWRERGNRLVGAEGDGGKKKHARKGMLAMPLI
jgi:hypothetical protein